MRLILLTCLTMLAFAANSILNRMAVSGFGIDPGSFAVIRVLSGTALLVLLVALRRRPLPIWSHRRIIGAGALATYMVGFSLAYLSLDAGLGALILFGVVQIAMFGWGAATRAAPTRQQIAGAAIAFAGLALVLWPTGEVRSGLAGAALMTAAGLGWAAYTLAGQREPDALAATAANFLWCIPVTGLAIWLAGPVVTLNTPGIALAILSGAVTSGMGYALWYSLIPQLGPVRAATVQLSVPLIALAGGAALLAEPVGLRLIFGAVLVIGGIGWTFAQTPRNGS